MATVIEAVVTNLREVYDPEIPVNIYDLGLVYDIEADDHGNVTLSMTLTSPNCPAAQDIPMEAQMATLAADGVASCAIRMVWDPAWTVAMMSSDARAALECAGTLLPVH